MGLIVFFLWRMMKLMPQDQAAGDQARLRGLDQVGRGRRRRRGQGRAAGGRRLPARPGALPRARREGAEGHPAARPARHRQDAAGQGGRQRVRRAVLRAVGRRRFVEMFAGLGAARIRRLFARGAQARAGDRLHRRDRRRRRRARLGQQLRARADAQPAAGRDGRLRRHAASSSSSPPPTCSRSSIRRCCAPAASTARSSSRRPTSTAARRSSASTRATSRVGEDVDFDDDRAPDRRA